LTSFTGVALDLETTGLDPSRDAIIEIGLVRFRGEEILDEWSSLVNPGKPVPASITRLTGITSLDVAAAPRLGELAGLLRRFIGDAPLVAHNAGFDLGFLRSAGISFAQPAIDTFELASIVLPSQPSYNLTALLDHFGQTLTGAHRALADAHATARLMAALQDYAATLPLPALIEINRLAALSQWSLQPVFAAAEKQATRTVFLKRYERLALQAGDLGPLLNPAANWRPTGEELAPVEQTEPLDVDTLAGFLEPGGPLATVFAGYEHRSPQVDMLRAVADAFNNGDHLLIEAGTGTGKSLAYLLPAIAWAVQNRRRVVISTNTINLQDQLVAKDVPDLVHVFDELVTTHAAAMPSHVLRLAEQGRSVRVALLKGRANYLCPRRLDAMRSRENLSEDELRVLARVLVWLGQTITGDRGELFLPTGRDQAVWARLATESGACTPERCETSQRGRCFFHRNRQQAEAAHLLIVNHALLLSDVAVNNRVLPEYRHLIIDEAHHLEDATTNQLSFQATQDGLERLLADIYPEGGQERSGILYELRKRAAGLAPTVRTALEAQVYTAQRQCERSRDRLRDFFTVLASFLEPAQGSTRGYSQRIRLDSKVRSQPGWSEVETAWDTAGTPLYDTAEALTRLSGGLVELEQSGVQGLDDLNADLANLAGQFLETYEQLHATITQPSREGIYWVEVAAQSNRLSLHAAPLHIGPLVEAHLFHQKDNVILTSATLRTAGSYDYIRERLHASEAEMVTVGSPFDYRRSTLVYIPSDMADPNTHDFQAQAEAAIRALARALSGRTMALFTSHDQLRRTADAIAQDLLAAGIAVYQQGDGGSRRQLLENFRANPHSVLLGTRSFWEGVDVVGPALSGLVLTRLPFAVPTDPIVAARAETFDSPFYQYSVPDAILRFRQGFGRLIRSQSDRGVCVILDNRVLTKQYGQLFLQSLPDCTMQRGPLALLPKAAKGWLEAVS
jgi:DNA polymerase-3 subunit epsilon/ATP-dependent DNA helicase DinG